MQRANLATLRLGSVAWAATFVGSPFGGGRSAPPRAARSSTQRSSPRADSARSKIRQLAQLVGLLAGPYVASDLPNN